MKNLNKLKILEISSNKKFSEKKLLEEFNWDLRNDKSYNFSK